MSQFKSVDTHGAGPPIQVPADELDAATVERCAQVAIRLNGWGSPPRPDIAEHIASAIRSLIPNSAGAPSASHYGSRAEWNTRSLHRTEPQTAPGDRRSQAKELAEWIIGYLVNECALDEGCVAPSDRDNVANAVLNHITGFVPNDLLDAADELLNKPGIARIRIKSQGHNLLDREEVFRRLVRARKAASKADANAPADAERLALDDGALLNRLKTEAQLAKNGGHPILERSFNLAIDEIKKLREAAKGQLVVVNVAIAERQRAERNRDMWKGQCERQAEELTALRAGGWREDMETAREALKEDER